MLEINIPEKSTKNTIIDLTITNDQINEKRPMQDADNSTHKQNKTTNINIPTNKNNQQTQKNYQKSKTTKNITNQNDTIIDLTILESSIQNIDTTEQFTNNQIRNQPNDNNDKRNEIKKINITTEDMKTVYDDAWLNDAVINAHIETLLRKYNRSRENIWIMKTYFMSLLVNFDSDSENAYNYDNVCRWCHPIPGGNIFLLQKLFVPINENNLHWTLIEIDFRKKTIIYHDSLLHNDYMYCKYILQFLRDEYRKIYKQELKSSDWNLISNSVLRIQHQIATPKQQNSFDCGVFLLMTIEARILQEYHNCNQQLATKYRQHIQRSLQNPGVVQEFLFQPPKELDEYNTISPIHNKEKPTKTIDEIVLRTIDTIVNSDIKKESLQVLEKELQLMIDSNSIIPPQPNQTKKSKKEDKKMKQKQKIQKLIQEKQLKMKPTINNKNDNQNKTEKNINHEEETSTSIEHEVIYDTTTQKHADPSFVTQQIRTDKNKSNFFNNMSTLDYNDHWGDPMVKKSENSIRLFFQNINSFQVHDNSMDKIEQSMINLNEMEVDLIGIAEPCINWNNRTLAKTVNRTISNITQQSTAASTTDINLKKRYLPGGTMSIATNLWTNRILKKIYDTDGMSRWSGFKLRLNATTNLFYLAGYRVSQVNATNCGTTTGAAQQYEILRRRGIINPNPKDYFISDFIKQYKTWEVQPNDLVILMLDSNEPNLPKTGIRSMIHDLKLTDAITQIHGKCNIKTYNRGKNTIDHVLCNKNVIPHIRHVGYTPFQQILDSDHRGIFLDLDSRILAPEWTIFKRPKRQIGHMTTRNEGMAYKKRTITQYEHHRIEEKSESFVQQSTKVQTQEERDSLRAAMNKLDSTISEILLSAERKIIKTDLQPTSNAIYYYNKTLRYWRLMKQQHRTNIDYEKQRQKIRQILPEEFSPLIQKSDKSPEYRLKQIKKIRLLVSQTNKTNRQEKIELENFNIAIDSKKCPMIEKKQKQQLDNCKQNYRTIKNIYNTKQKSTITHIKVPNPEDESKYIIITDPKVNETKLIDHCTKHFGQAEGTFWTRAPASEFLNYEGTNATIHEVKDYLCWTHEPLTFNVNDHPKKQQETAAKILMEKLSDENNLPEIDNTFTFNEFKSTLKNWKEDTTTSPSGRHLGHIHICFRGEPKSTNGDKDNDYDTNVEKDVNTTEEIHNPLGDRILKVYYNMVIACLTAGIYLERWTNVSTTMIEKTPGDPRIDKLRVLHIYEVDYNLILKIMWARKLVWHAHDNNALNSGQTGSKPGGSCPSVVLQKIMKNMFSQLSRTPIATLDNDAKSCYDRIVCKVAMLVSRYYGMSLKACELQSSMLKNMKFSIRTAYGDSKTKYQHTKKTPIHGFGQGGCGSPAIWLLISSSIMDCQQKYGKGMNMISVNKQQTLVQWIDGFVNDTTIYCNNHDLSLNEDDLILNMTHDANLWSQLLQITGGKLQLQKCFYFILSWKFDKNGQPSPKTISDQTAQREVYIYDENNNYQKITQIESTDTFRTLGCHVNGVSNSDTQYKILLDKSERHATTTNMAMLHRRVGRLTYSTLFIPQLLYSMSTSTLSKQQICTISNKATSKYIPAMGYHRGTAKAIMHGPRKYGGVNLPHLYTESEINKIMMMLSNINFTNDNGKSIMINLSWLQLTIGISTPVLEAKHKIRHMKNNWFIQIANFLHSIKGQIKINNLWLPTPQRVNDVAIMDLTHNMNLSSTTMSQINAVRMHFQALWLSDIIDPSGTLLLPRYLEYNNTDINPRKSKLQWPIQPMPDKNSFNKWIYFLQKTINIQVKSRVINIKLGAWINHESNDWTHYFEAETNSLYKQEISNTTQFKCTNIRRQWKPEVETELQIQTKLPQQTSPVNVMDLELPFQTQACVITEETKENLLNNKNITFSTYLQHQSSWEHDLLQFWESKKLAIILPKLQNMEHDPPMIVTDGSVQNNKGSYCAVISFDEGKEIKVQGRLHPAYMDPSSMRAESAALLSGILMLQHCIEKYNIVINKHTTIIAHLDNQALIQRVQLSLARKSFASETLKIEYDIIQQIVSTIKKLQIINIFINVQYIKAHQEIDENSTVQAKIHHWVDIWAGEAHTLPEPRNPLRLPSMQAQLFLDNKIVTGQYKRNIRMEYYGPDLKQYLIRKNKWSENTFNDIDWNSLGSAIKSMSYHDIIRCQKISHNLLATNEREAKWYEHRSSACASCQQSLETFDHILQCTHPSRTQLRKTWINETKKYFLEIDTPPLVATALIYGIHTWLDNKTPTLIELRVYNNKSIIQAFNAQHKIGWQHIFRGRLSKKWSEIKNIPDNWGPKIIQETFNFSLQMWANRNEFEHSSTHHNEKSKLLQEVNHLMEKSKVLDVFDQDFLHTTMNTPNTMSINTLQTWIRQARSLIGMNKSRHKTFMQQMQRNWKEVYKPVDKSVAEATAEGRIELTVTG